MTRHLEVARPLSRPGLKRRESRWWGSREPSPMCADGVGWTAFIESAGRTRVKGSEALSELALDPPCANNL